MLQKFTLKYYLKNTFKFVFYRHAVWSRITTSNIFQKMHTKLVELYIYILHLIVVWWTFLVWT